MTSTNTAGAEPILLAFSGGLDTSFCVPWLKDTYGRPVITVTVDTGDDAWRAVRDFYAARETREPGPLLDP